MAIEAFSVSQTLPPEDSLDAGSHIFVRVILGKKLGLRRIVISIKEFTCQVITESSTCTKFQA